MSKFHEINTLFLFGYIEIIPKIVFIPFCNLYDTNALVQSMQTTRETMSEQNRTTILNCIRVISQRAKGQTICLDFLESVENETNQLALYLNSNQEEAFFFAVVSSLFFNGREVDLKDLCRFFQAEIFEILPHLTLLDNFVQKGFILRKGTGQTMSDIPFFKSYTVASEVCEAIVNNKPCPSLKKTYQDTLIDVLEMTYDKIVSCIEDELSPEELFTALSDIVRTQQKYNLFKTIKGLHLTEVDCVLLCYISWHYVIRSKRVDADRVLRTLIKRNAERAKYLQEIYYEQNVLIKQQLIETKEARFFNDVDFHLTEKAKQLLEADGFKMPNNQPKRSDLILPSQIAKKELFYNEKEKLQIAQLNAALDHEAYTNIYERLKNKQLGSAMTILLFGGPGTGKTELVLQLARQTGRQIMKIDISKTKSMWFGESEKIIKKIFDDYKSYAQSQEKTPILFFNEADAVLSKRTTDIQGNTTNTENGIQNLLLDEFENFDGILIATTNLTKNLDPAYDRRFLFKIQIEAPNLAQRQTIWQSKLSFLDSIAYKSLAEFELTGGQIANISRKCEILQVLEGHYPDYNDIEKFCQEEQSLNTKPAITIGFGRG